MYEGDNYNEFLYSGLQGRMMAYLHRHLEKPFRSEDFFPLTVEIGAGEGQHLPYVRHTFERYVMTDIRPLKTSTALPKGVEFRAADAHVLPFEPGSIDRLISTCVLHHLAEPERALQSWRASVKKGGHISILLATDPGILLRVGRNLTTRRAAHRLGIDYDLELAREHRNHAGALMVLIDRVFSSDRVRFVGIPFPIRSWNLNFSSEFQIVIG